MKYKNKIITRTLVLIYHENHNIAVEQGYNSCECTSYQAANFD